jgi:hypothetical protein
LVAEAALAACPADRATVAAVVGKHWNARATCWYGAGRTVARKVVGAAAATATDTGRAGSAGTAGNGDGPVGTGIAAVAAAAGDIDWGTGTAAATAATGHTLAF